MKSARINQYEGDILFNPSIRIFHYVCQFRSFTKAAKQLGITQSAVSQSIAQLEKQLGYTFKDKDKALYQKIVGDLYNDYNKQEALP